MKRQITTALLFLPLLLFPQTGTATTSAGDTLTTRQSDIVAIAACTGKSDLAHLKPVLSRSIDHGMTVNEAKEILIHAYAYCGFPRSLRALQTLMEVTEKRKAQGLNTPTGREASPVADDRSKYERGAEILARLSGTPADAPKAGYAQFAPVIERFLKEHLFCDIFERDVLSYPDRELATVAILGAIGGVEPMLRSHMGICIYQGITPAQLRQLADILESTVGQAEADALRNELHALTSGQN